MQHTMFYKILSCSVFQNTDVQPVVECKTKKDKGVRLNHKSAGMKLHNYYMYM